jgi:nitroreductase
MTTRRQVNIGILSTVAAGTTARQAFAQAPQAIALPLPAMEGGDAAKNATSGATAGVTAQNVYLFCASAGLATVLRESVPEALAKILKLPPGQIVQFAQTVGYPKL